MVRSGCLRDDFVPHLVWLPAQVSKLSDRERSVVQEALKSTSWAIYRKAPVDDFLQPVVEEAWATLPVPAPLSDPVLLEELNWFESTVGFLETIHAATGETLRQPTLDYQGTGAPKGPTRPRK